MKAKIILSILSLSLILSCGGSAEKNYTAKGPGFTLQVPESMSKTSQLNDEASLQYQSILKNMFVIVIDESKDDMQAAIDSPPEYAVYNNDLEGYYGLVSTNLKATLSRNDLPKPVDTKINGLPAKILDVEGFIEDEDISWKFAFIQGKKTYYQVVAWTSTDQKEDNEKAMNEIVNSFRETNKSKY